MKKSLICMFIIGAVLLLGFAGQEMAQACSASCDCKCHCLNGASAVVESVSVNGSCKKWGGILGTKCKKCCAKSTDKLTQAWKLCRQRHITNCMTYCYGINSEFDKYEAVDKCGKTN